MRIFILFFVLLGGINVSATSVYNNMFTNEPLVLKFNGKLISVTHEVKGPLNLFQSIKLVKQADTSGVGSLVIETSELVTYYLMVEGVLHEINDSNYKKQIKKHLPNATDLHKRLGKLGFRFENIPDMIQFYNKFRIEN